MRPRELQQARNRLVLAYAGALAALSAPILAACGGGPEGSGPQDRGAADGRAVGRVIQAVIGGSPSGTSRDAVVVLARFTPEGVRRNLCSATLVAPNLVVTARHCVSDVEGPAGCGPDGTALVGAALRGDAAASDIAVFVGDDGQSADTTVLANASARGAALVVESNATTICNRDLAFVVLDAPLATPIAPLRFGPPTPADVLTAVGWGVTEGGELAGSRLERSGLAWLGLGPMLYPESDRFGVGSAEAMVGESVCAGDSGGPLLAATGAIVGVASRVGNGTARDPANLASTCVGDATHAVYTELGAHQPLVARAFEVAGQTPWVEGKARTRSSEVTDGALPNRAATLEAVRDTDAPGASDLPLTTGDPPTADEATLSAGGGCSASPRPADDAVPHALGATAVLLLLARISRWMRGSAARPMARAARR